MTVRRGRRKGGGGAKTTIALGDMGVLTQHSGPRASKTKDSCTSLRFPSVNSVSIVLGLGYHSATGTLAWATAAERREGSGGRGSGRPRPHRRALKGVRCEDDTVDLRGEPRPLDEPA